MPMEKKHSSGIWIFWAVLFGVISMVSVTALLVMYLYFTVGEGRGFRQALKEEREEQEAEASGGDSREREEAAEEPSEEPAFHGKEASGEGEEAEEEMDAAERAAYEEALREDARAKLLADMKAFMQEENSTVKLLRQFYPDDVIVFSNAVYNFVPVDPDITPTSHDPELFVKDEETGRVSFSDPDVKTHFGIDVSKFQTEIDWQKVAGEGVEFALIRLGLRGYSEGAIMLDETYEYNIDNAAANGIHTGVYFFSQAKNREEAKEELDFVFENLEGHTCDGPIVIDIEDVNDGKGRTGGLSVTERTDIAKYFCEEVKKRGREPMIYGNLKSFILMLDLKELEEYAKWYAYYDVPVYYPYDYDILQYSDTGRLSGISGDVDLNLAFKVWYE